MSHKFSHMFGTSFSDYCNALRLEDARRMLSLGTDSVTDVALASGFGDVSYFIRLFRESIGLSPSQYIRARRVLHAKRLLSEGVSVEDASEACGYQTPSALYKAVLAETGRSPSALRALSQKEAK